MTKQEYVRFFRAVRKVELVNECPLCINGAFFNTNVPCGDYSIENGTLDYEISGDYDEKVLKRALVDSYGLLNSKHDLNAVLKSIEVTREELNELFAEVESESFALDSFTEDIAKIKDYDGENKASCIEDLKDEIEDAFKWDFISKRTYDDLMAMINVNLE